MSSVVKKKAKFSLFSGKERKLGKLEGRGTLGLGLRTFGEYADMYVGVVLRKCVRFRRIDVVFDRYRTVYKIRNTKKKIKIRTANPPPVITTLPSGACRMSSVAKKNAKSSLFSGKERKFGKLEGRGTLRFSITLLIGCTDFDFFFRVPDFIGSLRSGNKSLLLDILLKNVDTNGVRL
jgi:hypothetical protein